MKRVILALTLLVGAIAPMGCCHNVCNPGMGCGPWYLGAYADHPPTCEPCDGCGNWTGHCDPCARRRPPAWRHGTYGGPILVGDCFCPLKGLLYKLKYGIDLCGDQCGGHCGSSCGGYSMGYHSHGYHEPMAGPPMMASEAVHPHHGRNCNCH
jgi:hypothetical protein